MKIILTEDLKLKSRRTWLEKAIHWLGIGGIVIIPIMLFFALKNPTLIHKNSVTIVKQIDTFILVPDKLKQMPLLGKGTVASICNNPGAIVRGNPNVDKWAIGYAQVGRYEFLIFPTDHHGFQGLKELLLTTYKNHTLVQMFQTYAPSSDGRNNPMMYANNVANKLGVSPYERVGNIKNIDLLCQTIGKIEGWYADGNEYSKMFIKI